MDQSYERPKAVSHSQNTDARMDAPNPNSNRGFSSAEGVLGTRSKGLLDDDDEEEMESQLDVARMQDYSHLPLPGGGGLHAPHHRGGPAEASNLSTPYGSRQREAKPHSHAFRMAIDDDSVDDDMISYSEDSIRPPPRVRNRRAMHSASSSDEGVSSHALRADHSENSEIGSGSCHTPRNRSESFDGDKSPLGSAMRRARDSMLAFQQKESPTTKLKPEELKPQSCPSGSLEPALPLKTSRKCLERIRAQKDERPAVLQTGVVLRKRPTPQEQQRCLVVECDCCQQELLVEKTAVLVACPTCRTVSAASDSVSMAR